MKRILRVQSEVGKKVKGFFKKSNHGQKGFTLIELLVVVAILGVLAAVVMPNVSKFMGSGKTEAAATELANVSLAVTASMASAGSSTFTAVTTATNSAATMGLTDYLAKATTAYWYTITSAGVVTQTLTAPS